MKGQVAEGQGIIFVDKGGTACDTADACQQFLEIKGLYEVIVGTGIQTGNFILQSSQRGNQDYRRAVIFPAHKGKKLGAVNRRNHPV